MSAPPGYRLGIDVGGTFTDFVLVHPNGRTELTKVLTTPSDQSLGVMSGIASLAAKVGVDLKSFLARTDRIVHGTTTADNTMIQMNGAVTGLLTTQGHRDQIEIRRGYKEQIWDPAYPGPTPIAPRRRRFGVPERLDFQGEVVTPLDEQAARQAIRRMKKQGVESIAVCLLFSYVNPAHELRLRKLIQEEYPEVRVSLSHQVMPTAPEFERTSTTLVDAYVGPRVERYLKALAAALSEAGYAKDLQIMQSNGGIMAAGVLAQRAVATLGSGPTGGVTAAAAVARDADLRDFIAVDMGGTSFEVCVVKGGTPQLKSGWNWFQRYLVGLPTIEMHSIGAGGGSIARVEAGALKVGPTSAGADPGPICYGRGGREATVTDANLVLGYLNPRALCGGEFELRDAGVRDALVEQIGRPLGLDAVEAANGIFRIVNANMVNAIRRVSSQAGLDPREFCLVVYGGNGPIHAGKQAEELGIRRMLIPRASPAFSALGLLIADVVVDASRAHVVASGQARPEQLEGVFQQMERQAETELETAGIPRADMTFHRSLAMCYPGQTFDMSVPVQETLQRTIEKFHDLHEALHTYATRNEEPIIRAARLRAVGRTPKPELPRFPRATSSIDGARVAQRSAFLGGRFVDAPVYDGERLTFGHRVEGPAIVEERFTSLVLHPGHVAEIDARGNYAVTVN
jgi:N-methylhydantoinase A